MKKQTIMRASALAVILGSALLTGCETAPPVREYSSRQYYMHRPGHTERISSVTSVAPVGERIGTGLIYNPTTEVWERPAGTWITPSSAW